MIQDKIKELADGLCLALCYCELWGIKNDGDKLKIIAECVRQGYIEWDGTVKDPIGLAKLCGRTDIKDIKKSATYDGHETVVANFTHNGYNHFVLVLLHNLFQICQRKIPLSPGVSYEL